MAFRYNMQDTNTVIWLENVKTDKNALTRYGDYSDALLTAKPEHSLGRALFLLKNRFLALVLPNLKLYGYNFAHTYCCTEYTCGPT